MSDARTSAWDTARSREVWAILEAAVLPVVALHNRCLTLHVVGGRERSGHPRAVPGRRAPCPVVQAGRQGGCRHPRSELDAELAPCGSLSWVVEVVGAHSVVWGAELVAEGGGELSFGSCLAGEYGDGAVEFGVGYVMAVGPVVPGGEAADVEPVFADGGEHGVEAVDGVAVAELVVGLALGRQAPGRGCSTAGAVRCRVLAR